MTRKEKNDLIERIESIIPTREQAKGSPFLEGMRSAYIGMILEITGFYYNGVDEDE